MKTMFRIFIAAIFITGIFNQGAIAKKKKTGTEMEVVWQRPEQFPQWWENFDKWKKENPGNWIIGASEYELSEKEAIKKSKKSSERLADLKRNDILEFGDMFVRAYNFTSGRGRKRKTTRKYICYSLFNKKTIVTSLEQAYSQKVESARSNLANGELLKSLYDYEAAEYIRLKNPDLKLSSQVSEIKKIKALQDKFGEYFSEINNYMTDNDYSKARIYLEKAYDFVNSNKIKSYKDKLDILSRTMDLTIKRIEKNISVLTENFKDGNIITSEFVNLLKMYEAYNKFNFDTGLKSQFLGLFDIENEDGTRLKNAVIVVDLDLPESIDESEINITSDNFKFLKRSKFKGVQYKDFFTDYLKVKVKEGDLKQSVLDESIKSKSYFIEATLISKGSASKLKKTVRETHTSGDEIERRAKNKIVEIINNFVQEKLNK